MATKTGVYPLDGSTNVDVAATPSEVKIDNTANQIVESTTQDTNVTVSQQSVNILTVGYQGPAGPSGPSGPAGGEEVPYAVRVDDEGGASYKGWAAPGSLETDPVWRIRKRVLAVDANGNLDYQDLWADGDDLFDNIWANHLTLNYV